MKNIISKLKNVPWHVWILILIILLGTFLRTYHFHDWLTFNPDQARDAMIVDNVLQGNKSLIMLGPEAGNTRFDLGPWFYHLEILSAKIFGNQPSKLAYPDLLLAILTLLLFYLVMKRYFNQKISLILTFFLSISYFMIRYSRFAFNPNSIPFFLLVFILGSLYLLEDKKNKWWGAILVGIGVGVAIQLHAILIFTLPLLIALVLFYLFFKKVSFVILLKELGIIIIFVLITNIGQIIYNTNHGNSNFHKFRKAFTQSAGDGSSSLKKNVIMAGICQASANWHILTSLGSGEKCEAYSITKRYLADRLILKTISNLKFWLLLITWLFTGGGYLLGLYFWRKEKNKAKKDFLLLLGVYSGLTFVTMVPIISQASMRYYIVLFFLPFIFLGFWIKYFWEKKKVKYIFNYIFKSILVIILLSIICLQLKKINQIYIQYRSLSFSNTHSVALDEAKLMMNYIVSNAYSQEIYITGRTKYFSRYYKPFLYLGKKFYPEIEIKRGDKTERIKSGATVYYISKPLSVVKIKKKTFLGRKVKNYRIFANLAIIEY